MPQPDRATNAALSHEDEQRPVVGFLRLAGWSDEKIAEVVAAHKRGEVYEVEVTLGGPDGIKREARSVKP